METVTNGQPNLLHGQSATEGLNFLFIVGHQKRESDFMKMMSSVEDEARSLMAHN